MATCLIDGLAIAAVMHYHRNYFKAAGTRKQGLLGLLGFVREAGDADAVCLQFAVGKAGG